MPHPSLRLIWDWKGLSSWLRPRLQLSSQHRDGIRWTGPEHQTYTYTTLHKWNVNRLPSPLLWTHSILLELKHNIFLTVISGLMANDSCSIEPLESEPTTGVSRTQMTLAAGSLGKVMEPAWVQAGQLCSTVGTVLGPQRGRWGNRLEMVNHWYAHNNPEIFYWYHFNKVAFKKS